MKYLIAISSCWLLLLLSTSSVQAQTATESASPSPEVTTQNLKERIERVVQEKKEAIKGAIDRMGTQKRGFIGEVQRISEETISVKTSKGVRIVAVNDPDLAIFKNQQPIKLENIAVGDWIVAMGFAEEDGTFTPRRLLVSSQTLRPKDYRLELGNITEVTRTTVTITTRVDGSSQEFTVNRQSKLQDIQSESITLTDIEVDMQALVVSYTDDENQIIQVLRVLSDLEV